MKNNQVERMWICQLNKPGARAALESFRAHKDKSKLELMHYYKFVVGTLMNTPAWGVSGVNKMLNDLTRGVRATLNDEKRGKTSAYAHAGVLLNTIDRFGNEEAKPYCKEKHKLIPLITDEEFASFMIGT